MHKAQLLLSLSFLVSGVFGAEGLAIQQEKAQQQVEEGRPGSPHHEHRRHSSHGEHHHHRRRHSHDHDHHRRCHRHRHHSHDHGCGCEPHSPPCDLSICTSKIGNFTVVTRPVTWEQAEGACAMIGLRLARVNIENFMDATKAAFQCSGPFSQTWVHSWNGDSYDGKGLVLSTGNAAPGGAINQVADNQSGRNVLCEVADCPVVKPRCHDGCGCQGHRHGHGCGCNHGQGPQVLPANDAVLHSKMKCLRCFCNRNVDCPLQSRPGTTTVPMNNVSGRGRDHIQTTEAAAPTTSESPTPTGRGRDPVSSTQGRLPPTGTTTTRGRGPAKTAEATGVPAKALQALGRFLHIPEGTKKKPVHKKQKDDVDDGDDDSNMPDGGEDSEGDDDYGVGDDDFEVEKIIFDQDEKSLGKHFPFTPETCGAQCVCYACKDWEPERHHCHRHHRHHHRCRRHSSHHECPLRRHSHHDEEPIKSGATDQKTAIQLKAVRLIAAFDADGNQIVQEKTLEQDDGQVSIQIQDL